MSPEVPRLLRKDAQRNREALLAAARRTFAEQGLNASLEQVARTAGVAIGTLYRHFPNRDELVVAVFADKLRTVLEAGERGLELDDAWEGFRLFLETLCELQAEDRGFNELSSLDRPASGAAIGVRDRMHAVWRELLRRAQEQGAVRADLAFEDMFVLLWSHSMIIDATFGIAPRTWRRHLYLMLDAYRAPNAHPLPEPPLTEHELKLATERLS
ncbi:TetR/AcrR family transcriptional regulator [Amycolatopsis acidiphila]|uniref:TetR/AcrR family transcriptional regulator n=1 Tax=Amycolatopsis acidiphila TaxID=715473 RepID=A0A557ZZ58_9PSEU|nr:TetR/AcrR family transcriptional regulator [Amycolatopsis acidiphila]TVT17292.1 TetR/AcrR family transcriptional regulator [Amycolatopsis acidiphila]UIJ61468.1 TetR/AcrR family transcriptional regulator [Amycolatopsis acidiphila]